MQGHVEFVLHGQLAAVLLVLGDEQALEVAQTAVLPVDIHEQTAECQQQEGNDDNDRGERMVAGGE